MGRPEDFSSYLPRRLIERVALRGAKPFGVSIDHFEAAALFADITGFTALAERLAKAGPRGAERLTELLDLLFGLLIERILDSGGDIMLFAGDAILAVWPTRSDLNLDSAARVAVRCALSCQDAVAALQLEGDEANLTMRIGVGAGECALHEVGGVGGRWLSVATGQALVRMGRAEKASAPGDVVVADEVFPLIEGAFVLDRIARGWKVVTFKDVEVSNPGRGTAPLPDDVPEELIRAYLPDSLLSGIDAGQARWIAELRTVSTVFVQILGLNPSTREQVRTLQTVVTQTQELLREWEGALNKIMSDDKGTTIVIGYGLPPWSHEDDAVRAVRTAIKLREFLRNLDLEFGIGVTTGRAFCGAYGSDRRREYTMLGDSVNLSARLMATARNDILCDQRTVLDSIERLAFVDLPPVSVKGKAEPVVVSSPIGELDLTGRHEVLLTGRHETLMTGRVSISGGTDGFGVLGDQELPSIADAAGKAPPSDVIRLVGRGEEKLLLERRLDELLEDGREGVVVLEAEAGFGKSLLGAWLHGVALARTVTPLLGASEPTTRSDAWHPFRDVFAQLLELDGIDDPALAEVALTRRLQGQDRLLQWAPLIGDLLPITLKPNETTERMTGANRGDALRELLAALLRKESEDHPQLIILEDVHWMDATSWAFVRTIVRSVSRVLLVLITRPMGEATPAELTEALGRPDCDHVVLDELEDPEVIELACRRLQVRKLPPGVAQALTTRAEGNPFFAQELAFALVESGAIAVENGVCTVLGAGLNIDLPDTLQGVITSRLDRLSPKHGLTTKVASVIGRNFGQLLLAAVHPQEAERPVVRGHLDALADADIAELEVEDPDPAWAFRHIIIQETAYSLLPYSQRRELHREIAQWYEAHPQEETLNGPLLAWHWRRAEELQRAIDVLEVAGEAAVRRGAPREGLALLDEAVELEGTLASRGAGLAPERLAHWHEQRGLALMQMGDMAGSKATCALALKNLGFPLPTSKLGWGWMLTKAIVVQLRHRFLPPSRKPLAPDLELRLKSAGPIFALWGTTAYFTIEVLHWFLGTLAAVNLADRTGDDQAVGDALGAFGNVVGALKLERAAMHYFDRCRDIKDAYHRTVASWAEAVFEMTYCRWDRWREVVDEGIALGRSTADHYTLGVGLTVRAVGSFLGGDLELALEEHQEVLISSRRRGNIEHESWSLTFGTPALLALGRDEVVEEQLEACDALVEHLDPFTHVGLRGVRAQVRARRGDFEGALADVVEMLAIYGKTPIALFTHLPGFAGAGEAVLAAVAAHRDGVEVLVPAGWTLKKLAKKALGLMDGGAFSFFYFRPRRHLLLGTKAWHRSKQAAARKAWSKGLAQAEQWNLPYEAALISLERARLLPAGTPDQVAAADDARRRLTDLGATGDLARLDAV